MYFTKWGNNIFIEGNQSTGSSEAVFWKQAHSAIGPLVFFLIICETLKSDDGEENERSLRKLVIDHLKQSSGR